MVLQIPQIRTQHIEIVDEGLHTLNKRRVSILKEMAKSHELSYTVHAPFAGINITAPPNLILRATVKRLQQSIINASMLDCALWIFHPGMKSGTSMFYPGKDWIKNLKNVQSLANFAEDHGVRVGIENVMEPFLLKDVGDFRRFYKESQVEVALVFDTGHANIVGEMERFLKEFPERIVHIHAHDNHGKSDEHLAIGDGSINWQDFANYVNKIRVEPTIIVESVDHAKESLDKLKILLY